MNASFTDRARTVIALAAQEAKRLNHEYIGTEHLLLGIAREGKGPASIILTMAGVDVGNVRRVVEKALPPGQEIITIGNLPRTPRAKLAMEYAAEEARWSGCHYIGDHHILLGLAREKEGVASVVLSQLGATDDVIRKWCSVADFPSTAQELSAPKASMSLRDYFAGQAIQAVASVGGEHITAEQVALSCYGIADALIAQRVR